MPSMNRVMLMGHLGKDPETRRTKSGNAVVNLSLATSRKIKDDDYATDWHSITLWGSQAENCDLFKGDLVLIPEGTLYYEEWEDSAGNKRREARIKTFQYIKCERKEKARRDDDVPF